MKRFTWASLLVVCVATGSAILAARQTSIDPKTLTQDQLAKP